MYDWFCQSAPSALQICLFAFGRNNTMYWAVAGPSGKKWWHVIELLNFCWKLFLQPHLILIKDPMWNSPEESPSGVTFLSCHLFCSCLGVHGYIFYVCYPKLLGYFICLVSIWVSFNIWNERGVVNKFLFPVHLQDLLVSVGVRLYTEQFCPLRKLVSLCNYRFSLLEEH